MLMKRNARIALLLLLVAGLWLALKPTLGNRRFTFLPFRWSEFIDIMDFWLNLGAFAILGTTVWLAFGSLAKLFRHLCLITASITLLNITLELVQSKIRQHSPSGPLHRSNRTPRRRRAHAARHRRSSRR